MTLVSVTIHVMALATAVAAVFAGVLVLRRYATPTTPEARRARRSGAICLIVGLVVLVQQIVLLVTGA